jgi:hypothetical protein
METHPRSTVRVDAAEAGRRLLIGALLGIVWFLVLLIPEGTRLTQVEDRAWWYFLALMIFASASVSLFLPVACLARHVVGRLFAVVVLPAILALVFSELVFLGELALVLPAMDLSGNPNGPVGALFGAACFVVLGNILGVPITAAVAYVTSILVTLPMGYVHVRVLRRWADGRLVFLDRQEVGSASGPRVCAVPPAG